MQKTSMIPENVLSISLYTLMDEHEMLHELRRSCIKKLESREAKMREDINSLSKVGEASEEEGKNGGRRREPSEERDVFCVL